MVDILAGRVVVELAADNSGLQRGLQEAQQAVMARSSAIQQTSARMMSAPSQSLDANARRTNASVQSLVSRGTQQGLVALRREFLRIGTTNDDLVRTLDRTNTRLAQLVTSSRLIQSQGVNTLRGISAQALQSSGPIGRLGAEVIAQTNGITQTVGRATSAFVRFGQGIRRTSQEQSHLRDTRRELMTISQATVSTATQTQRLRTEFRSLTGATADQSTANLRLTNTNARAERSLVDLGRTARTTGTELQAVSNVGNSNPGFQRFAIGAGVAAAGAAGLSASFRVLTAAAEEASDIRVAAEAIGTTSEEFQRLLRVLATPERFGLNELRDGIVTLREEYNAAIRGDSNLIRLFREVGIEAGQSISAVELFTRSLEGLQALQSQGLAIDELGVRLFGGTDIAFVVSALSRIKDLRQAIADVPSTSIYTNEEVDRLDTIRLQLAGLSRQRDVAFGRAILEAENDVLGAAEGFTRIVPQLTNVIIGASQAFTGLVDVASRFDTLLLAIIARAAGPALLRSLGIFRSREAAAAVRVERAIERRAAPAELPRLAAPPASGGVPSAPVPVVIMPGPGTPSPQQILGGNVARPLLPTGPETLAQSRRRSGQLAFEIESSRGLAQLRSEFDAAPERVRARTAELQGVADRNRVTRSEDAATLSRQISGRIGERQERVQRQREVEAENRARRQERVSDRRQQRLESRNQSEQRRLGSLNQFQRDALGRGSLSSLQQQAILGRVRLSDVSQTELRDILGNYDSARALVAQERQGRTGQSIDPRQVNFAARGGQGFGQFISRRDFNRGVLRPDQIRATIGGPSDPITGRRRPLDIEDLPQSSRTSPTVRRRLQSAGEQISRLAQTSTQRIFAAAQNQFDRGGAALRGAGDRARTFAVREGAVLATVFDRLRASNLQRQQSSAAARETPEQIDRRVAREEMTRTRVRSREVARSARDAQNRADPRLLSGLFNNQVGRALGIRGFINPFESRATRRRIAGQNQDLLLDPNLGFAATGQASGTVAQLGRQRTRLAGGEIFAGLPDGLVGSPSPAQGGDLVNNIRRRNLVLQENYQREALRGQQSFETKRQAQSRQAFARQQVIQLQQVDSATRSNQAIRDGSQGLERSLAQTNQRVGRSSRQLSRTVRRQNIVMRSLVAGIGLVHRGLGGFLGAITRFAVPLLALQGVIATLQELFSRLTQEAVSIGSIFRHLGDQVSNLFIDLSNAIVDTRLGQLLGLERRARRQSLTEEELGRIRNFGANFDLGEFAGAVGRRAIGQVGQSLGLPGVAPTGGQLATATVATSSLIPEVPELPGDRRGGSGAAGASFLERQLSSTQQIIMNRRIELGLVPRLTEVERIRSSVQDEIVQNRTSLLSRENRLAEEREVLSERQSLLAQAREDQQATAVTVLTESVSEALDAVQESEQAIMGFQGTIGLLEASLSPSSPLSAALGRLESLNDPERIRQAEIARREQLAATSTLVQGFGRLSTDPSAQQRGASSGRDFISGLTRDAQRRVTSFEMELGLIPRLTEAEQLREQATLELSSRQNTLELRRNQLVADRLVLERSEAALLNTDLEASSAGYRLLQQAVESGRATEMQRESEVQSLEAGISELQLGLDPDSSFSQALTELQGLNRETGMLSPLARRAQGAFGNFASSLITNIDNASDAVRRFGEAIAQSVLVEAAINPLVSGLVAGIQGLASGPTDQEVLAGKIADRIAANGANQVNLSIEPRSSNFQGVVAGSRGDVSVVNNFQIQSDSPSEVRAVLTEFMPQITNAVKGQIMVDLRRPSTLRSAVAGA